MRVVHRGATARSPEAANPSPTPSAPRRGTASAPSPPGGVPRGTPTGPKAQARGLPGAQARSPSPTLHVKHPREKPDSAPRRIPAEPHVEAPLSVSRGTSPDTKPRRSSRKPDRDTGPWSLSQTHGSTWNTLRPESTQSAPWTPHPMRSRKNGSASTRGTASLKPDTFHVEHASARTRSKRVPHIPVEPNSSVLRPDVPRGTRHSQKASHPDIEGRTATPGSCPALLRLDRARRSTWNTPRPESLSASRWGPHLEQPHPSAPR